MSPEEKKEYLREYAVKNRERINENRKKRYHKDPSGVLLLCAKYRAKHPEQDRKRKSDHRKKHILKYKENRRKWVEENWPVILMHAAKRRAIKAGAVIGDTELIVNWEKRWREAPSVRCYWCRAEVAGKDAESEHIIPLSKGGVHALENLCISCGSCNAKKGALSVEVWNSTLAQPVLL